MFSWYKYLLVSLVFSHLGFWSGNRFLIAPFPDRCILVPFYQKKMTVLVFFLKTLIVGTRKNRIAVLDQKYEENVYPSFTKVEFKWVYFSWT